MVQLRQLGGGRQWILFDSADPRRTRVKMLLDAVPAEASVAAQIEYVLVYSSRAQVFCLPRHYQDADYVVVDRKTDFYPASPEEYARILHAVDASGDFRPVTRVGTAEVYARRLEARAPSADGGIVGRFYPLERPVGRLPELGARDPAVIRRFSSIDFPVTEGEFRSADGVGTGLKDLFAAVFTGTLFLEQSGVYVFGVESDDGFRLTIDERVVAEWNDIRAFARTDVEVELTAGRHPFRLDYFANGSPSGLRLTYVPPAPPREVVPARAFRPPS
jgi:hypothetical protein